MYRHQQQRRCAAVDDILFIFEAFEKAFEKAYADGKPCIIECMLDIDEMVAPMVAPGSPIDSFCLN